MTLEPIGREGANLLGLHPCIGYFTIAGEPCTYDPGWGSTPCLICWQPLGGVEGSNVGGNLRTISVLHGEDDLSLFYRVHISCAKAHPEEIGDLDASAMHGKRGAYAIDTPPEHPFIGHPSAGLSR